MSETSPLNPRTADHAIECQFKDRHSPRAMSGAPLPRSELLRLLEAARFAPSAANLQPWRFVLAEQGTEGFEHVLSSLLPFNADWAKRASAFIVVAHATSRVNSDGETVPLTTGAFDTGAAWMSIALQGHHMGLVIHGMGGFEQASIREKLKVPEDVAVVCVVAVGLPGDPSLLLEKHQAGERPNSRKPLEETVFFGGFSS